MCHKKNTAKAAVKSSPTVTAAAAIPEHIGGRVYIAFGLLA